MIFLIVANVRECEFLPYAVFQPFPGRLIAAYEEIPGDGTYIAEILPIIDEYFFIFIADFRDFVRSAFRIGDRQFPAVGIFHQMQPTQFGTCLRKAVELSGIFRIWYTRKVGLQKLPVFFPIRRTVQHGIDIIE